ncbi:protein-disulfide reductase DsbD family protein [Candidatus Electrothrix sp.]|uniref:protein-disulfide reductase DsbD family protein n=3 Tax=Candidatus Electrothrix sp. TaxID=2170559 RepID=UPI0040572F98
MELKNSIYSTIMLDNKNIFSSLLLALLLFVSGQDCHANLLGGSSAEKAVNVRVAWSVTAAHPGDQALLAVVIQVNEGFHINADERQILSVEDLKLFPTKVVVTGADKGLKIEAPLYPQAVPLTVPYLTGKVMSFQDETVIYLPVRLEESLSGGRLAELSLQVHYQPCSEEYCLLPVKEKIETSLPIVAPNTVTERINQELFKQYEPGLVPEVSEEIAFNLFDWKFSVDSSSLGGVILLLIVAAFGGMLLNFTPCVLPLIPIKIISLSYAAKNRRQCILLGVFMSLGVLMFWLGLGALIALVSGFSATNQLFQYPVFTISVGLIIAVMAGGMFDFFSLQLPAFVYMIHPEQDTLKGSFGLGILAAVLSTPCTAPFMGAAAAWASTQPPASTLAVFAAIGIGMALPYFLLSISPDLVSKMPKTGPASILVKQVMGLLMLAAAAYFVGIGLEVLLSSPADPPGKLYWWPVMFFTFCAGGWTVWRTVQIASQNKVKYFFTALGAVVMLLSVLGSCRLPHTGPIDWTYYTAERLELAQKEKKTVVMVFTAEWCLNCKVLEQGVLENSKIIDLLDDERVLPMKVDITGNNPEGKAKLKEVGSLTIPLLVVVDSAGKEVYKSDYYTVDQVYQAVQKTLK